MYKRKIEDKLQAWLDDSSHKPIVCVPVECKFMTGDAKSLRTVLKNHDKYHVDSAIKLGDYNIGRKENLLTIPLYMAFLLTEV